MTSPTWQDAEAREPGRGGVTGHAAGQRTGGAGDQRPPDPPARILAGRYRLAEQIGRGGMGIVWRARDQLLDRDVAVKEVSLPSTVSEAERAGSYQRTLREARTAARLSHPGVATVHDVVEEHGRPLIVMELVAGRPLDRVIAADGPLTPQAAARLGRQVAAALAAAHAAGVLHRDVKPGNVLLAGDGRAVLTDFGIAIADHDPKLTQTGMVIGSPRYLAPERLRGAAASPASDMWSLGATLYAAVEGNGPYDDHGNAMTTIAAVLAGEPRPPRAAGPLAPVLHALLSRDPAQRPTAAAAVQMLDAIAVAPVTTPTAVVPAPGPGGTLPFYGPPSPGPGPGYPAAYGWVPGVPPGQPPRRRRRRRLATFAVIGVAIFIVIGLAAHAHPPGARAAGRSGGAPGIGSPVRDGKFQFTVTRVGHASSVGGNRPGLQVDAQGAFTLVHVTVTNISARPAVLTDVAQYVYDASGRKYAASSRADIDLDGARVLFNNINPGNTVRAVFAFDMPGGTKAVKAELHDSLFSGGVTVYLR